MCLALPAAFFVSPPEKIRRTDGTPVKIQPFASWKAEARSWWACLSDKRILILLPYLFYYVSTLLQSRLHKADNVLPSNLI